MHAVIRTFSGPGAKQLFDGLEEHKADVEASLRKVSGLVSYTLLRHGDGGAAGLFARIRPVPKRA